MMQIFIRSFVSLSLLAALLLPATSVFAAENVLQPVCENTPNATLCQGKKQTPESNSIFGKNGILTKAARILLTIVGVAAVIMVIIGGLQYVIGSGDPARITSAKNTILYALIGLVVAVLAQAILAFVIRSVLK